MNDHIDEIYKTYSMKEKEKLKRADLSTNMAQAHAANTCNAILDGNHCCNTILQQHC